MNISTVLLLEDMGANYQLTMGAVVELNVMAEPDEDSCLPESPAGQCCVTRNLSAESQFGVNSSYRYGVVDLPGGPNMGQTNVEILSRSGCNVTTAEYNSPSPTRKNCNSTLQPLKMFEFIIGESKLHLFIALKLCLYLFFRQ